MRKGMGNLTAEAWILIAAAAAVGVVGSLYGVSFLLDRELAKIRLARRAREVVEAHRRKAEAMARGDGGMALLSDDMGEPIEAY